MLGHPVSRLAEADAALWVTEAAIEERIVSYADKRATQRVVSLDQRFDRWRKRHPEFREGLDRACAMARRLEAELCEAIAIAPTEVERLRWVDDALERAEANGHLPDTATDISRRMSATPTPWPTSGAKMRSASNEPHAIPCAERLSPPGESMEVWRANLDDDSGEEGASASSTKRRARALDGIEQHLGMAPLFGAGTLVIVRQPAGLLAEKAARERLLALVGTVPPGNALCCHRPHRQRRPESGRARCAP